MKKRRELSKVQLVLLQKERTTLAKDNVTSVTDATHAREDVRILQPQKSTEN